MKPWDIFWADYTLSEAEEYYIEWRDSILKSLMKSLMPARSLHSLRVLEAGCGYGSNIRRLQRANIGAPFALDLSFKAVWLAHTEVMRAAAADILHLPFPQGSFDLVFNAGVVEHFADPMVPLHEMARVVRPGGWLCVFVPGPFNLWQLYRQLKGKNWEHGFEQAFSPATMRQFAERLGLHHIRSGGVDSFTLKGALLKTMRICLPFEVNLGFGYQEVYVSGQKEQACHRSEPGS